MAPIEPRQHSSRSKGSLLLQGYFKRLFHSTLWSRGALQLGLQMTNLHLGTITIHHVAKLGRSELHSDQLGRTSGENKRELKKSHGI